MTKVEAIVVLCRVAATSDDPETLRAVCVASKALARADVHKRRNRAARAARGATEPRDPAPAPDMPPPADMPPPVVAPGDVAAVCAANPHGPQPGDFWDPEYHDGHPVEGGRNAK